MNVWICALLSAVMVTPAFADAVLELSDEVTLTGLDGQEVKQNLFRAKKRYVLPAGQHVLQARFEKLYDINADNHDVLRSVAVNFAPMTLQDGQRYQLQAADVPSSYVQAQHYAKAPTLRLLDAQSQQVLQQVQGKVGDTPSLLSGVSQLVNNVGSAVQQMTTEEPTALQRFKGLWAVATPDERRAMQVWIKQSQNAEKER